MAETALPITLKDAYLPGSPRPEPLNELRERHGISIPIVSAEQVENDSSAVTEWLRGIGASHVAIHFDLDVLEPTEFNSAVWHDPNGLRAKAAVRLLADVSRLFDVVGLGITEHTPHVAIWLCSHWR